MKLFLLVGFILSFGLTQLIQSELGINWEPKRDAVIKKMKEIFTYYNKYQNFDVALEKQRLAHTYILLLTEKPDEKVDAHQLQTLIYYFEIQFIEIHNQYIDNQIPNDKYQPVQWYFDYQYYLKFIYWPIAFIVGLFLVNLIYYCIADNCLKIKRE
ncbi:unnamed protein product [Paramecium pentaurelia]|uniref:Transmembrane protein n=1 Tax=Paramecium pentaurelia TaxID=43138 RepID=A0A8S1XBT5_9CILI|nr:unnamed protein product [Paramecium pentaurelia]